MKSIYGDRDTHGTTYVKAQGNSVEGIDGNDINTDMVTGLIEDLNEAAKSNPFDDRDFYVNCVEERDLQMKNAFKRRLFKTLYRPYPEDNTLVFKVSPTGNRMFYCWDMPHFSEFPNILTHEQYYDKKYVDRIKDWIKNDLSEFGYIKVSLDSSHVEGYDDKLINVYRENYVNYCNTIEMDAQSIENEKKFGFFWLPNKFYKDEDVTQGKSTIILMGT